jgi:hypothetical protein
MKRKLLFALTVTGLVLIFAAPVIAANTGITGKAVDGYGGGWQHGGTVYIIRNCSYLTLPNGKIIITGGTQDGTAPLSTAAGTEGDFSYTFSASIADPVCIYVEFNKAPGSPYPAPAPAQAGPYYTQLPWVSGVLSVGNIGTGTGPTAVTLAGVAAEPPNSWGSVMLAVVALVGVGSAVLLLRRRRTA